MTAMGIYAVLKRNYAVVFETEHRSPIFEGGVKR